MITLPTLPLSTPPRPVPWDRLWSRLLSHQFIFPIMMIVWVSRIVLSRIRPHHGPVDYEHRWADEGERPNGRVVNFFKYVTSPLAPGKSTLGLECANSGCLAVMVLRMLQVWPSPLLLFFLFLVLREKYKKRMTYYGSVKGGGGMEGGGNSCAAKRYIHPIKLIADLMNMT